MVIPSNIFKKKQVITFTLSATNDLIQHSIHIHIYICNNMKHTRLIKTKRSNFTRQTGADSCPRPAQVGINYLNERRRRTRSSEKKSPPQQARNMKKHNLTSC